MQRDILAEPERPHTLDQAREMTSLHPGNRSQWLWKRNMDGLGMDVTAGRHRMQ